jgi:hypothetical protein
VDAEEELELLVVVTAEELVVELAELEDVEAEGVLEEAKLELVLDDAIVLLVRADDIAEEVAWEITVVEEEVDFEETSAYPPAAATTMITITITTVTALLIASRPLLRFKWKLAKDSPYLDRSVVCKKEHPEMNRPKKAI